MAFTRGKYQADDGSIHTIRMESTRYGAAGTPPTADVDSNIKVEIGKSNREHGIRPRCVVLARTIGTAPDLFQRYSLLPVLTATDFGSATFAVGATVTIDSVDWEVIAQKPEDY